MTTEVVQQNIREILWQHAEQGERLYAVLEGVGERDALRERLFTASDLSVFPLYFDTDFDKMLSMSPLCVSIPWRSPFLDWLLNKGFSIHPGILACGACEAHVVARQHFQSLLEVILPDLNLALFRFYDPVVLHRYAYTVQGETLFRLMGPLRALFWMHTAPTSDTSWHRLEQACGENFLADIAAKPIRVTEEQMQAFELAREYEFAALLHRSTYLR